MSRYSHQLSTEAIQAIQDLVNHVRTDLLNPANALMFTMSHADDGRQRDAANQHVLNQIGRQGGIYAIWVEDQTGRYVRYIGHTAGATARQRIRNHFITKDPRTGSQLENVNLELEKGNQVGVTYVAVDPPYIRLIVEELLINELSDDRCWNKKSRVKAPIITLSTL